jgi:hypothetical protein
MATPSHVDLSVLWVPIMPETSKLGPAMEEAGKDATETFGKATAGIGDKVHESFTKATGKVKDVFTKAGSDASESMADGVKQGSQKVEDAIGDVGTKANSKFKETAKGLSKQLVDAIGPDTQKMLGDRLEEVVSGSLDSALGDKSKWGGKLARSIGDWGLDELKNKLGGVKDEAQKAEKSVGDVSAGNTGKLAALVGNFDKVKGAVQATGVEVKDLPEPLQDVVNKTNEAKTAAESFSAIFKDLPGIIGRVGGPIATLAAAVWTLRDQEKAGLFDKTDASGHEDWWKVAGGVGGSWLEKQYNKFFHGGGSPTPAPSSSSSAPSDMLLGPGGSSDQASSNFQPGGDPKRWGGTLGSGADAYDAFSSGLPVTGPGSGPIPGAPSSFTAPSGSIVPRDVGSDKGLTPTSSQVKKTIATMFPQINDIGGWRPPDGYNEHSSGQALDVMIPGGNTALGNQIRDYVMAHAKELGVDYALWQQTQWNPDGSSSRMSDRGSPTQNHMDHVHIHTVRGGGNGTMPTDMPSTALGSRGGGSLGSSGMGIPTGAQHDPLYIMPADSSGGSSGGSSSDSQAQQLGSGLVNGVLQGFGLDGSVFKTFGGSSNPLQFGITKLATGLLNTFAGGGQQGGGSLGGGGSSILPGLGGLIPHAGSVPVGPGGAQNVRTGETPNVTNHFYGDTGPQLNVTQNGQGSPTEDLHGVLNGAGNRLPAMVTSGGNLPVK